MNFRNPPPRFVGAIKLAIFLAALWPLARLIQRALADNLGANPIEAITHKTGWWALAFLLITLAVMPLRQLTGWPWLARTRRMLGLFAFAYAVLHFATYLVLDQFFDWPGIVADIVKRPYITVGFAALLALVPLAATSTDGMIRRLGGKRWKNLHRLVYPIACAGVLHFAWLVKKDLSEPMLFGSVLAGLLIWRAVRAGRSALRANGRGAVATPPPRMD